MTEKRFIIDKDGITVIDNCTDGLTECKYSNEAKLLCNFLNELWEENEQLKKQIAKDFNQSNCITVQKSKIMDLEKENEQLKSIKKKYKGQRDYLLFVIERSCSKELFEETKSYLAEVEDKYD